MRCSILLVLALLGLTGCNEATGPTAVACDPFLEAFGPVGGDTVTTADGIRYVEVRDGSGTPAGVGNVVQVNYSLYLMNGQLRDSSCPATRDHFALVIGGDQAIVGFQLGLLGMRTGGIRRVIVPSSLAYGGVPGHELRNEDLIFDIEMLQVL
jgi:FKBP-type peptidyl-prolyl cis-trans isomerase